MMISQKFSTPRGIKWLNLCRRFVLCSEAWFGCIIKLSDTKIYINKNVRQERSKGWKIIIQGRHICTRIHCKKSANCGIIVLRPIVLSPISYITSRHTNDEYSDNHLGTIIVIISSLSPILNISSYSL